MKIRSFGKKLLLILFAGVIFSCNSDDNNEQNSIVGTWKIVSLTINDNEELQNELGDLCYWTLEFTKSTFTSYDFSGSDCKTKTDDGGGTVSYTINGNNLQYTTNYDQTPISLEIMELTSSTLKIRDSWDTYVYIYTYTKI